MGSRIRLLEARFAVRLLSVVLQRHFSAQALPTVTTELINADAVPRLSCTCLGLRVEDLGLTILRKAGLTLGSTKTLCARVDELISASSLLPRK